MTGNTFDQQPRQLHLQCCPRQTHFSNIVMCKSMITYFKTIAIFSSKNRNILFGIHTDYKKSSRHFFTLKNIQYLWSPFGTWTVVESKNKLMTLTKSSIFCKFSDHVS